MSNSMQGASPMGSIGRGAMSPSGPGMGGGNMRPQIVSGNMNSSQQMRNNTPGYDDRMSGPGRGGGGQNYLLDPNL